MKRIFFAIILSLILLIGSSCTSQNVSKNIDESSNLNSDENKEYIHLILGLKEDQDIAYAGKFIGENGMNVRLVYKSSRNISGKELAEKIERASVANDLAFIDSQYSMRELEEIRDILWNSRELLNIVGIGIQDMDNKVFVQVKKLDDEVKSKISELVDINALILQEGESTVTSN